MIPDNPSAMSAFVEKELAEIGELQKTDGKQFCQRMSAVANYLKILRRLPEAQNILEQIDEVIKSSNLGLKTHIVNQLRWADVKRYNYEFSAAKNMFEESLIAIDSNPELSEYKDFALQHLGKLYFDTKDYQNALNFFNDALKLRQLKKNQELIESTQFAIDRTIKNLEKIL